MENKKKKSYLCVGVHLPDSLFCFPTVIPLLHTPFSFCLPPSPGPPPVMSLSHVSVAK